jgi:hypothetical protein
MRFALSTTMRSDAFNVPDTLGRRPEAGMKILDCSSEERAATTFAAVAGLTIAELDDYLREADLDKVLTGEQMSGGERGKHFYAAFNRRFRPQVALDGIIWFHFTRAFPDADFGRGLLPLGSVVNELWQAVRRFAGETLTDGEWLSFRAWLEDGPGGRSGALYRQKVRDSRFGGPFGCLIRDAGLRAVELGTRDFFRGSELIEDILRALTEYADLPSPAGLIDQYRAATSPTIVSFVANPRDHESNALACALYYIYLCRRKQCLTHDCVTGFDARGRAIPADRVIRVERCIRD